MLRILFLDDNSARHKTFEKKVGNGHLVTYVWSAIEAQNVMISEPRFDVFSLDHDLGGEEMVDINKENTGSAVARFIVNELPQDKYPEKIIIHSMNPIGAKNMETILVNAGFNAARFPFINY
jgi:CheY-like chemotaxis protein